MINATISELQKVIALADVPKEHLEWILSHSEYHDFPDGSVMTKKDDPIDVMWILLEGKIDFYSDVNGRQVYYFHFQNDPQTGGVGGVLPYSRMKTSIGYAYAVGRVRALSLHKKHFPELERMNPDLIQRLIGYMTERARIFATTQMQHEKVSALGNLAAGIAHELNNPASAINRISEELSGRLQKNFELTEKLFKYNINAEYLKTLKEKLDSYRQNPHRKLSAVQTMEKEDEVIRWFDANGLSEIASAAEAFVAAGISESDFDSIRVGIPQEALPEVLLWIENLLTSRSVIKDLEEASSRISHLVGAIKSHVHMDRTNELQSTDLHNDIDNTLTLLGYKLREKKIIVQRSYCDDLEPIPAVVGELNQVWTNLIDNAIYALPVQGTLTIETACGTKDVDVKIIDNGSGIPEKIISRIFDPFFTTKKVGEGTGIGLDLVNRIIKRHNGEIKVHSKPGRTEFHVRLPRTASNHQSGRE